MARVKGLVIRLPDNRLDLFERHVAHQVEFGQPVSYFPHANTTPILCFVFVADNLTHLAHGYAGQGAGSQMRTVRLYKMLKLRLPLSRAQLLGDTNGQFRAALAARFEYEGLLTEKGREHLIKLLLRVAPESREILDLFSEDFADKLEGLSPSVRKNLAAQKEAVMTAILLAGQGFDRKVGREWKLKEGQRSFLDGLPGVRLSEDKMIFHDMRRFPGFEAMEESVKGSIVFSSASETLTIVLANRDPLEQLTGADLIYYNDTYDSFVFVQYKALDDRYNNSYRPDSQLEEELQRMESLLKYTGQGKITCCDDFRLHGNPFFLKLCQRNDFEPESTELTMGMYIPLEYWNLLVETGQIEGPRGGMAATFDNVGRYLSNSEFATLVAKAWVGSNPAQSAMLNPLISETIQTGRAVVYAVKHPRTARKKRMKYRVNVGR